MLTACSATSRSERPTWARNESYHSDQPSEGGSSMKGRFGRPLAVAVVALAVLAAACGNSNNGPSGGASSSGPAFTTIKAGTLTVGSCLDYSPFEYYKGGQLKGFDVEIMQN